MTLPTPDTLPLAPPGAAPAPQWLLTPGLMPHPQAVAWMESRVAGIAAGTAPETIWLVEHPPLYTAGTSARPGDLTDPHRFPVHQTGRGGQYTYHGPGQRVVYVMLDLNRRGRDGRLRKCQPGRRHEGKKRDNPRAGSGIPRTGAAQKGGVIDFSSQGLRPRPTVGCRRTAVGRYARQATSVKESTKSEVRRTATSTPHLSGHSFSS